MEVDPSSEAVARREPSALMARSRMPSRCPQKVLRHWLLRTSHALTLPSTLEENSTGAVGCGTSRVIASEWAATWLRSTPLMVSHSRMEPFMVPAAAMLSCDDDASASMEVPLPRSIETALAVMTLVMPSSPSSPPESTSGDPAIMSMQVTACVWNLPPPIFTEEAVCGFQRRRVLSAEPVISFLPFFEKVPQVTYPPCPENTCMQRPLGTFHIQQVPS